MIGRCPLAHFAVGNPVRPRTRLVRRKLIPELVRQGPQAGHPDRRLGCPPEAPPRPPRRRRRLASVRPVSLPVPRVALVV